MPKEVFQFKKFSIRQEYKDVMKVSTDSVLLGCFTDVKDKRNALDIGCGTGLLCLMMAQKNHSIKIIGIDINSNACKCAQYNVESSQYAHQIQILHSSLKNFLDASKFHLQFDTIISNPPYFSKSLKSYVSEKNAYRHQEYLSFLDLIDAANILLSADGSFYVIVPFYELKSFINLLQSHRLYIHRQLDVFSTPMKQNPYISLFEIRKYPPDQLHLSKLIIYNEQQKYTHEYLNFTKEFYLFA